MEIKQGRNWVKPQGTVNKTQAHPHTLDIHPEEGDTGVDTSRPTWMSRCWGSEPGAWTSILSCPSMAFPSVPLCCALTTPGATCCHFAVGPQGSRDKLMLMKNEHNRVLSIANQEHGQKYCKWSPRTRYLTSGPSDRVPQGTVTHPFTAVPFPHRTSGLRGLRGAREPSVSGLHSYQKDTKALSLWTSEPAQDAGTGGSRSRPPARAGCAPAPRGAVPAASPGASSWQRSCSRSRRPRPGCSLQLLR